MPQGTQFTCFTGTKVLALLVQKYLLPASALMACVAEIIHGPHDYKTAAAQVLSLARCIFVVLFFFLDEKQRDVVRHESTQRASLLVYLRQFTFLLDSLIFFRLDET